VTLRLLDLCCKAGGASEGYRRAGFTVTGSDREPQPRYPFPFIQADLRDLDPQWIAHNFDAVAGSPPCWDHSVLKHRTGRDYEDFIPETRALFKATGLPYVIENVVGAPLIDPLMLCGTQFPGQLRVKRHRLFESNIPLTAPMPHPSGRHPLHFTHDKRKAHYGLLDEPST
jgi:DNA (cytosine-5)-methyltransferase 1